MSNTAKIDQNDRPTWLAYNETTGLMEPVQVDSVTGAILVYGVTYTGGTFTAIQNAKIDANDKPTLLGYNETSGLTEALRCGNSGELLVIEV